MVNVAQLVRALDCGSKGRGFEPHLSPFFKLNKRSGLSGLFCFIPKYIFRFWVFCELLLSIKEIEADKKLLMPELLLSDVYNRYI